MYSTNVKIISRLRRVIEIAPRNRDFLTKFCVSDRDFLRSRKLPFFELVLFILKLCKKTLSVELDEFFEEIGSSMSCSVSAFTQQRIKLKPAFFIYLNGFLARIFYLYYNSSLKLWKGYYRIIAADGSSVSLVNTPELRNYFGGQSNQNTHFVLAKTFYHYDVLNELIVHAQIKPYRTGEMNMAYKAVADTQANMVLIYDRNFSNYKVIALHLWQKEGRKFVIRAKETQNMIKAFIESGADSIITEMKPTPSAIKGLKKNGFLINRDTLIKVRLVRVQLSTSVEVLITNLWEEEGHSTKEFKDLYFLRWGIETNISIQKNILQLEAFSGLTAHSVLQDFYATVIMTNLHSILLKEAQQKVDLASKTRKYPMKINKNKSFAKLKTHLVYLFVRQDVQSIIQKLYQYFIKEILPVRKGRSFTRIRKNVQSKTKFKTFTNFKPAY